MGQMRFNFMFGKVSFIWKSKPTVCQHFPSLNNACLRKIRVEMCLANLEVSIKFSLSVLSLTIWLVFELNWENKNQQTWQLNKLWDFLLILFDLIDMLSGYDFPNCHSMTMKRDENLLCKYYDNFDTIDEIERECQIYIYSALSSKCWLYPRFKGL